MKINHIPLIFLGAAIALGLLCGNVESQTAGTSAMPVQSGQLAAQSIVQQTRQPPAAPRGLIAIPGVERVRLSWQAAAGATGYRVYWNENGDVTAADRFEEVETVPQLEHRGLSAGAAYSYRIAAFNEAGEGPLSAEVSAIPAAPLVSESIRSDSAP